MSTGVEYLYYGVERSPRGWVETCRKLRAKSHTHAIELRHSLHGMRVDDIRDHRGQAVWVRPTASGRPPLR